MSTQCFCVKGQVIGADDPRLQGVLARVHGTPERVRCLCVAAGLEMYLARHHHLVLKRMPGTGSQHHPSCPSFEPELQQSGLGELVGEAVLESEAGQVELRVDFAWARLIGHGAVRAAPQKAPQEEVAHRRMSLRALMHYLFERAGFNRWSPAMQGKRNQGVLNRYLMQAAAGVTIKDVALSGRLYVPEPFCEADKLQAGRRRREKLALLQPSGGQSPLAIVIGEFKVSEVTSFGHRVWIKHMPDAPLLVAARPWIKIQRKYAPLFEARDADTGHRIRLMMAALIRARREHTYEIDAAALMMTTQQWIPVEGVYELALVHALIDQQRRFIKPLRYDATSASVFPTALLVDAGAAPVPLYAVSGFATPKERSAMAAALKTGDATVWRWHAGQPMPAFVPAQVPGVPRPVP